MSAPRDGLSDAQLDALAESDPAVITFAAGLAEAEAEITRGEVAVFDDVEELIADLHRD